MQTVSVCAWGLLGGGGWGALGVQNVVMGREGTVGDSGRTLIC